MAWAFSAIHVPALRSSPDFHRELLSTIGAREETIGSFVKRKNMERFQDENKWLASFADSIDVKCPKCEAKAVIKRKM